MLKAVCKGEAAAKRYKKRYRLLQGNSDELGNSATIEPPVSALGWMRCQVALVSRQWERLRARATVVCVWTVSSVGDRRSPGDAS